MSPQLQAHDLLAMRLDGMSLGDLKHHIAKAREVHEMLCALRLAPGMSANSRQDVINLTRRIEQQLEQAQLLVEEIQANDAHALEEEHEHDEARSRLAPPNRF
jgi:hypothetical protein